MKRSVMVIGVVIVVALSYSTYRLRRLERYGQQLRNLERAREIVRTLAEHKTTSGRYPLAINKSVITSARLEGDGVSIKDPWGTPYLYFSDGTWFILVSCGEGGVPDRTDYLQVRNEQVVKGAHAVYSICGQYAADQVFSDRGEHRLCGK